MSKYCQNCGTQMDDNAMFCSNCGFKVVNVAENQQQVQQNQTQQQVQGINYNQGYYQQQNANLVPKKKSKKVIIAISAVSFVLVVAIVVGCITLFSKNSPTDVVEKYANAAFVTHNAEDMVDTMPDGVLNTAMEEYRNAGYDEVKTKKDYVELQQKYLDKYYDELYEGSPDAKFTYKVSHEQEFTSSELKDAIDDFKKKEKIVVSDARKVKLFVSLSYTDSNGVDKVDNDTWELIVVKVDNSWRIAVKDKEMFYGCMYGKW